MLNLKAWLRRSVLAGASYGDRPDAEPAPEKPLRGGLQRWHSPPPGWFQKWEPPTKGTTPADRKRIRRRQARTPLK